MNTWFECTAKYIKMDESGHEKKVSETYLLDAVSFTEAESRIYKELQTMVSGEFTVSKIAKTRISEIIPADKGDRWFKAKVTFISINEESGKEKRTSQAVLVFSFNLKDAYDQIIEAMQGMMTDFEISGITESNIMDVFPYEVDKIPDNLTSLAINTPAETDDELYESDQDPDLEHELTQEKEDL